MMCKSPVRAAALGLLAASLGFAAASAIAQQAGSRQTREYVQAAASADQFEILAADTALTQSVDSEVREFAAQMLRDHQQHVRALRDAATNADLKAPEQTLSADQAQWLGALQGVSGKEFDTLYLTQQVLAHRSALVVEQTYAERGNDPDLQRLATSTVPLISSHIEMASHAAMNRRP